MSAGIMPDMYRHTARKSTVSKTFKPPANVSLCSNTNSNTHYPAYQNEITSKQATLSDSIECNIKLEKDVPQEQEHEPFLILPDNVTEEMIIGEEQESTNEDIIYDMIDQMINQVVCSGSNQIKRTFSIDTRDVDYIMDSIMDQFTQNANEESLLTMIETSIEESVNKSLVEITSMENGSVPAVLSQPQINGDVAEIEETANNDNDPQSCTCQCHQSPSLLTNEYFLFEQALKQTREEQQHERSLTNNRLIQTLKRQHEELINLYQQNKSSKQINISKTDREQQTNALHLHDSQIQTDIATNPNSKILPSLQQKPLVIPTINSSSNGPLTVTRNHTVSNNSTVPQLAPRSLATTTVTNKISTVTTKTTVVNNVQPAPSLPSSSPTTASHDVVDLTEEDEDDGTSRMQTQRTAPLRQSTSASQPPPAAMAATATRIRPTNRTIRPNNPTVNGQAFPLRPLPEHVPCDHTIARPQLSISQENATVRLTWNLQSTLMESIQNYEIYAYKQNATVTTSDWKKIGTVKSMRLPMAVTLKEFQSNSHYAFAVRAVSITNNIGPFCEPKTIFTGNTPVQPLHTSQLLNVTT